MKKNPDFSGYQGVVALPRLPSVIEEDNNTIQNGTITCYLPYNIFLSSSKVVVNVCIVEYIYAYCTTSEWYNLYNYLSKPLH